MAQVRQRVLRHFPDAEQIDDSILCFTKRLRDQPFAICYLDVESPLPDSKESLTRYQDNLIGRRYFKGKKSLQWSNYLYFLRSDDELSSHESRLAKRLIENDRTYARKFVISEKDLDLVLEHHIVKPTGQAQRQNVLSVWIEHLTNAGLEQAILNDDNLPTRLEHIESDAPTRGQESQPVQRSSVEPAQFLKTLELRQYRHFPLQRKFRFGTVNLIFGPNASGKTSLMEAIELFYCGRNKRNSDSSTDYLLDVELADGLIEKADSQRPPSLFRERNHAWYGQSEIRTNNLYRSFAQFNFLDTDAAVSLSDSTTQIEEDLSKLLVGPDASKIWRDIERVGDAIRTKMRDLRPYHEQLKSELVRLEKQLADFANERRKSDSILSQLSQMMARYGWKNSKDATEDAIDALLGSLTELISTAGQAVEVRWVASPVTYTTLTDFHRDAALRIEHAEESLAGLEQARDQQQRLSAEIAQVAQAREYTDDTARHIGSGVLQLTLENLEVEKAVVTCSNKLRGFEPEAMKILATLDSNMTVTAALNGASKKRPEAERALSTAQEEYARFAKVREESVNLAQQLRQIASKILETTENPDECPLCHTEFQPGMLASHITAGVDQHAENIGRALLARIHQCEEVFGDSKRIEATLMWLHQFAESSGEGMETTVGREIARIERVMADLAGARERLDVLRKEISAREQDGFSMESFNDLVSQLTTLGFPLEDHSSDSIERLRSQIARLSKSRSQDLEKAKKDANACASSLKKVLDISDDDIDFRGVLSRMRERLATTKSILTSLDELLREFPWPNETSISELIVIGEGIRKVASEARTALIRERRISTQQSEGLERKEELDREEATLSRKIERFSKADDVLNDIRSKYSLNQAMDASLTINRAAIEAIFSCIHAPAEFSGLGSSLATLVRKSDNREAKLTEISTGQRAAFGLSVFLAQNSQLEVAPPMILIDDPIAHVDDLNSLSFLDYLREIAISGKRQIFFATANDKLATLFERKFDFMGEEHFRRFDLVREAE